MNAAVLHKIGTPPRLEQFPDPTAGPDKVLVQVRAAALKPVDKAMANGTHYASFRDFPVVCGLDGIGTLENGTRVLFAGPRRPYGAMAERTVIPRSRCFPVPDNVDDDTAAAIFNPGISAWFSITWGAKLQAGETVLVLGATGVTGMLAVQIAKLRRAGRIIAAGRNAEALSKLKDLGATATIQFDEPDQTLTEAFIREAGDTGYNLIIDYLWGRPTEALLAAITKSDFTSKSSGIRLIQVGESAGNTISLPAAALRSSGLQIMGAGSGRLPPAEVWIEAREQLMAHAASGQLKIATERVPLAQVEQVWGLNQRGHRILIVP
jgi:NADPH:quinone reductase-like Zn-dependent oxidoreductase